MIYTIQQFAKIQKKNLRSCQRVAQILKLKKWGGSYVVEESDFERLLARLPGKVGYHKLPKEIK